MAARWEQAKKAKLKLSTCLKQSSHIKLIHDEKGMVEVLMSQKWGKQRDKDCEVDFRIERNVEILLQWGN